VACETVKPMWNNNQELEISHFMFVKWRTPFFFLSFYAFVRLSDSGYVNQPKHVVVNIIKV